MTTLHTTSSKRDAINTANALRAAGQTCKVYERTLMLTAIGAGLTPVTTYYVKG